MITAHYSIFGNTQDAMIVAILTGHWTCDTIDRYRADLLTAGAQLISAGVNPRDIGILIDTRAFGAQSQDVVTYYIHAFSDARFQSDRIAVVYESTLQKIQTRRMAVGNPRFFERKDEAVAWLQSLDRVGAPMSVGLVR